MGNLMSMEGYLNASAEFSWQEHDYFWKGERRYHDFVPGNEHNASCKYPRMWGQDGYRIPPDITAQQNGCRDSEFDMVSTRCRSLFSLTDTRSTVTSRALEHILRGNHSYPTSRRSKIA